jgi:hypothetical protein
MVRARLGQGGDDGGGLELANVAGAPPQARRHAPGINRLEGDEFGPIVFTVVFTLAHRRDHTGSNRGRQQADCGLGERGYAGRLKEGELRR